MSVRRPLALCCALLLPLASPQAAELVILVDTATEMPMAHYQNYRLVDGIHKDVGEALSRAMGREPRFVGLPRKRIVAALQAGSADLLCGYVPEWLPGKFEWSQSFLPQVEVVISDRAVERPRALADLGGKAIGTVFGYSYPELERALGQGLSRDDGPSMELNLRKLSAGRLHHMVTMKSWIEYRLKQGGQAPPLHPALAVTTYNTRCALAPNGKVSLAEVERAVAQIIRDGTVAAIAARYK